MNKFINRKDLPYIAVVIVLGSVFHFLYDWTGQNAFVALFAPVNESVWEHLKILFFPYLFTVIWIYFQGDTPRQKQSLYRYFCSRLLAVSCGMLSIITLFYTYTGIIGEDYFILDILIFVISVFLTFRIAACMYRFSFCRNATASVFACWLFVATCFLFFTCHPPNLPLFFPPGQ